DPAPMAPPTLPVILFPSSTGWACISILYLALDGCKAIPNLRFPGSLAVLRAALVSAADVLKCQGCATRFLSGMQN
ncbi:uncharacterized protein A1O5_02558, partial [Cladophialophora psammophila CBS 110553]